MLACDRSAWAKTELQQQCALFAKHTLVSAERDRYALRAPESSNLWCEVYHRRYTLYVGGDFEPIGFQTSDDVLEDAVRRIATHCLRTAAEKAHRWFGDSAPFEARSVAVALHQLAEWRTETMEALAEECRTGRWGTAHKKELQETAEALRDAIEDVNAGEPVEIVANHLYNNCGLDSEQSMDLGVVPSLRLIRGKAALMRLHELLGSFLHP